MATQKIKFQSPNITPTSVHVTPRDGGSPVTGSSITLEDDGICSALFSGIAGDYTISAIYPTGVASGAVFNVVNDGGTYYELGLMKPGSAYSFVIPAAAARAALQGSTIGLARTATLRVTFNNLGDLSDRLKLWFTAKTARNVDDADATIQVTEADGLVILNGDEPENAAWGSLTVTDAVEGTADLLIYASATKLLSVQRGLIWDVKKNVGSSPDDDDSLQEGQMNIENAVTQATA